MSELFKSHEVSLPGIKNQQGRHFDETYVGFVYAYATKAKNRKINDGKGGDKQKKQDS